MSDPRLDLVIANGVATLTIKRADKLNALDADMVDAILPLCRKIERSDAFAVILTGEGDKSFCAGGDIAAWSSWSADQFGRHWVRDGHTSFDALARLSQPVIAVLNGHCLGGGLELAACADYRIAESHVKIGQPEAGLGIIPGWSGTQRAVRRFGSQLVRRMAMFGEVYTADQALPLGLVDRVVEKGKGLEAAQALTEILRARSPRATELAKMMINAAEGEDRERVLEAFAGHLAASSDDLKEGVAAFREKRKPNFMKKNPDMIRHLVALKFRSDVPAAGKAELYRELAALSQHIDGILDFRTFTNVSPEVPVVRGFHDVFWFDFRDALVRDMYLEHPAHKAVGAKLVAAMEGGLDGIFVADVEL